MKFEFPSFVMQTPHPLVIGMISHKKIIGTGTTSPENTARLKVYYTENQKRAENHKKIMAHLQAIAKKMELLSQDADRSNPQQL